MINITNEEQWALNVLNGTLNAAHQELQRAIAAKQAYIKLLESKYSAEYDPATDTLMPKKKEGK